MVAGSVGGLDDGILIGILADGAAFDHFEPVPLLAVVEGGVLSVGFDLLSPSGQIIQLAEDFLDLSIRQKRRLCELVPSQRQLFFRPGAALDCCFAEYAPRTGNVFAFAFKG